jgi:hypothetical protein
MSWNKNELVKALLAIGCTRLAWPVQELPEQIDTAEDARVMRAVLMAVWAGVIDAQAMQGQVPGGIDLDVKMSFAASAHLWIRASDLAYAGALVARDRMIAA